MVTILYLAVYSMATFSVVFLFATSRREDWGSIDLLWFGFQCLLQIGAGFHISKDLTSPPVRLKYRQFPADFTFSPSMPTVIAL